MYYGSIKEYNNIKNNFKQQNIATDFFRKLLKYEYNALCWLMYFGDFWEGLKYKNDNNYTPKWKWSTMEELLSSKDIKHLISNNEDGILENLIIFNQLPYH